MSELSQTLARTSHLIEELLALNERLLRSDAALLKALERILANPESLIADYLRTEAKAAIRLSKGEK